MNFLNIDVFPTIPRYYTAIAQWLNCMVYVCLFSRERRRFHGFKFALACGLALVLLIAELVLTESWDSLMWPLGMAGSIALMYALIMATLDIRPMQGGYFVIHAFMWSEFAASLGWQLYYYYSSYISGKNEKFIEMAIIGVVFAIQCVAAFLVDRKMVPDTRDWKLKTMDFVMSAVVAVLFFTLSNLSFILPDTPFTSVYETEIFNIRTLVDLGAVAVLYAMFLQQQELSMRYELDAIQNVLQTQYNQYEKSRDTIELINRKYHDIKHQIAVIRAEQDPEKRQKWLDSIEDSVAVYDNTFQTGNGVLDTILNSKSMTCREKNIHLTCVADGSLLDFMDVMDVCAVFGNALDNAVESVSAVEETDRRLIHLSVSREKGFVLIRCENYYDGDLAFEDGIPKSTKGDDEYHGFGVKSIRYTARKYNGDMSITAKDNWFDLRVLIPLEQAYC